MSPSPLYTIFFIFSYHNTLFFFFFYFDFDFEYPFVINTRLVNIDKFIYFKNIYPIYSQENIYLIYIPFVFFIYIYIFSFFFFSPNWILFFLPYEYSNFFFKIFIIPIIQYNEHVRMQIPRPQPAPWSLLASAVPACARSAAITVRGCSATKPSPVRRPGTI